MTMPHLMNCPHLADGWCLTCVGAQYDKKEEAVELVRAFMHAYGVNGLGSDRVDVHNEAAAFLAGVSAKNKH